MTFKHVENTKKVRNTESKRKGKKFPLKMREKCSLVCGLTVRK